MRRIIWLSIFGFIIIEIVLAFFFVRSLLAQPNQVGISIKSSDKVEVIAYPVLSPAIFFTVEGVRPEKGLLLCTQVADTVTTDNGTTYPVVRLNCGKTVLTISGISFQ